jgi:nitrogen fixation-related uncharacterized protein
MTTTIIVSLTLVIGVVGIITFTWSIINTRNKFYKEYKSRKRIK